MDQTKLRKTLKERLEDMYKEYWKAADAAERDCEMLGDAYLVGKLDGGVDVITEIYTLLYGEAAMTELWEGCYIPERR